MSSYHVSFYVKGKRFDLTIPAASHSHAKEVVLAQYPGARLIIVRAL